jgi:Hemerythrin HHE cation binding domain
MPSNAITVIHKFLRREMFDFAEQLFRAGPQDCDAIRSALLDLADVLHTHAAQEDARFEPWLRSLQPGLADQLSRDHQGLEDQLETIVNEAKALDPRARDCTASLLTLHLDWNRFLSAYLAHLDDEERTLFASMSDRIPPVSFLAQSAKERGTQGEEFLLKLWAVTTCEERRAIEDAAASSNQPHRQAMPA